jgi:hypothetical protein
MQGTKRRRKWLIWKVARQKRGRRREGKYDVLMMLSLRSEISSSLDINVAAGLATTHDEPLALPWLDLPLNFVFSGIYSCLQN